MQDIRMFSIVSKLYLYKNRCRNLKRIAQLKWKAEESEALLIPLL
jgi:hypothetical protein